MELELLLDLYSEMLVDQVVYSGVIREHGYVIRRLITDRGNTYEALELPGLNEDGFPITFWTDRKLAMPGWIAGFKSVDFITFEHKDGVDLLPYLYVRRAWSLHGKEWCKQYPLKKKTMDGFEHQYVLVPRSLVLRTSQLAMTWTFTTQGETDAAR